jgi:hypothetical protein
VADSLPPVAVRVARPYATEDELLENELETLTRTSITLVGAQPRPQGLVLRFELVLSSGQVLVRGEGRVVGYKPNVHYGMGGLTLRFTRLDTRSKALVDRAAALRDRRRPSATPPLADTAETEGRPRLESIPEVQPDSDVELEAATGSSPTAIAADEGPRALPKSPDRDALLERLRERSKALGKDTVQKILERTR